MAFPAVSLLDNFKRGAEEKPLSNGGKWLLVPGDVKTGAVVVALGEEGWRASTAFAGGEDGAYWNAATFANPALCYFISKAVGAERTNLLYACLSGTEAATLNGYVGVVETSSAGTSVNYTIYKITGGVRSLLKTINIGTVTAVKDSLGMTVSGGVIKLWHKTGEGGAWTVIVETSDSTYTTGKVGIGMRGNLGRVFNFEAGEQAGGTNKPHTLEASNGSAATKTAVRAGVHTQSATQASSASKARALSRVLSMVQAGSFGPQLPSTPVTDELESELTFNGGATWTVLAWAEAIGAVYQKNKGLAGKPKPVGWGGTEVQKLGARYNAASFRDPINYMTIREDDDGAAGRLAAIGICVPSGGERSGYFARIEATAEEGATYKVTLERWVGGVKTVLAETTIANNFFGAASTSKAAPFALTLVGGVLRLWLGKPSATATVLLTANDTTFTSGYNTMESVGSWMLSQEHAATMDGQAFLEGHNSKGHVQSTTQGSAATRGATSLARTLAATQTTGQTLARSVARSLSATQGSTVNSRREIARTFSFGVTQVASLARTLAQQLTSSQGSSASGRAEIGRQLSAEQATMPILHTAPARALVAASGAAAALVRAVARALSASQGQAASEEAFTEAGVHDHPHTLSAAQGASAALRRALARRLAVGATVGASIAHSLTRTLAASGGATARVGRTPAPTLIAASNSTAGLQHATQVAPVLSAMSSSSADLRRAVARALSTTTGSGAAVSFNTTEVPLPPPVNMAASSGTPQTTSEAVTPQGEASLGQSRLTSSVETTT